MACLHQYYQYGYIPMRYSTFYWQICIFSLSWEKYSRGTTRSDYPTTSTTIVYTRVDWLIIEVSNRNMVVLSVHIPDSKSAFSDVCWVDVASPHAVYCKSLQEQPRPERWLRRQIVDRVPNSSRVVTDSCGNRVASSLK